MTKMMREHPEHEIRETVPGFGNSEPVESVTKVFQVSKATFKMVEMFADVMGETMPHPKADYGFYAISVSAFEERGKWNGWGWMSDDLEEAGLDSAEFGY